MWAHLSVSWTLIKHTLLLFFTFLECSRYFSRMRLYMFYNVLRFQTPSFNTFRDMNFFSSLLFGPVTTRQAECYANEPIMHMHRWAQKPPYHWGASFHHQPVIVFWVTRTVPGLGTWCAVCISEALEPGRTATIQSHQCTCLACYPDYH